MPKPVPKSSYGPLMPDMRSINRRNVNPGFRRGAFIPNGCRTRLYKPMSRVLFQTPTPLDGTFTEPLADRISHRIKPMLFFPVWISK